MDGSAFGAGSSLELMLTDCQFEPQLESSLKFENIWNILLNKMHLHMPSANCQPFFQALVH